MTTYTEPSTGTEQHVVRKGDTSTVVTGKGYRTKGMVRVDLTNTGNGYIARFPARNCTEQDYYVCLDYGQTYDLILALSAFKHELGFE
jgi:hypothetical protein